ncbi:hypothetical protein FD04_GL002351 [Secundilactobacillus odoratitofui DSM 19909 = JCM 15043]|uniref:Uncharacterized protein n=1 Tax=Secundilactobacillus odoratitofui DSM 19909 = JCM 15043 TaxID=1423776 RepID=A0A0R1LU55_9LACO|nr:hypothetical protein [Secundilactobacillus odoratitofui]KRK99167.1 hypothetical protein FD04_GL002351 [Secundilactobacillus odoratitofui DSM 19909 = JCM 15043]
MKNYVVRDETSDQFNHLQTPFRRLRLVSAVQQRASLELTPRSVIMTESLITGYQEMSQLNEEIVQEYLPCEDEVAQLYLNQSE